MSLLHCAPRVVTVLVFPHATAQLVRDHAPKNARIIAVDAGGEAVLASGRRPDAIVGDMDSVKPETLVALETMGVAVHRHPAAKRDTDGALALTMVHDDEILFLGPGGGRADHALANLHLLCAAARRGRAWAIDVDAFTWVVTPDRPLTLHRPMGSVLSIMPFGERAEGVSYKGLQYDLQDATMEVGDPFGMSNVSVGPPQEIRVRKGLLLVIEPRA